MNPVPCYVCVYFIDFIAQAMTHARAELRDQPVAVLDGIPPADVLLSATKSARALGLADGMVHDEVVTFTTAQILKRALGEELSAQAAVLRIAQSFTARFQICPQVDPHFCVVLDMSGCERLYGTNDDVIRKVSFAFTQEFFSVQLAASSNYFTAVCLARVATRPIVVRNGKERAHLKRLPLSCLDVSPAMIEQLASWGLTHCGDVAGIATDDLVVRAGPEGLRLKLMANGTMPHLFTPEIQPVCLEESIQLDSPLNDSVSLLFLISPLLDRLLQHAGSNFCGILSVEITLELDKPDSYAFSIRPALPVRDRDVLLKLIHLHLAAQKFSSAITAVHLRAEPARPSLTQLGLLAPQLPDPLALETTMAKLTKIAGASRVGHPRHLDSHKLDPFSIDKFSINCALNPNLSQPSATLSRRQCRPPVSVIVISNDKGPAVMKLRDLEYTLFDVSGPWQIVGEWWSDCAWRLEQWDVRAASKGGASFLGLLVHDIHSDHWHLQAFYD